MTRLEKASIGWIGLWRERKEEIQESVKMKEWNVFIDELFEEFHGVNQEIIEEAERMERLAPTPVCSYAESSDDLLPF